MKYEINGRRVTSRYPSTQLSHIRNLEENAFDFLIAVVFDENYEILHGIQIHYGLIAKHASYSEHVNAHILHIRDGVLGETDVIDLRERLR